MIHRASSGFFRPIHYAIPRLGEHGRLSCWFGNHWWTLVRQIKTGTVVGVMCGACRKPLSVNDIGVE